MSFQADVLRLKNLKGVGRRRVANPELEEDLEELDMADTSMPQVNLPISDMEGGLAPESYDVRANEVITPQAPQAPMEEESFWKKLGRGLAMQAQMGGITSPMKSQSQQIAESPVTPEPAMASPAGVTPSEDMNQPEEGFFSRLGRGIKESFTPKLAPQVKENFPEIAATLPQFQEEIKADEAQQTDFMNQINQAQENPWEVSVYGAANKVGEIPDLQEQVKVYTGIDWTPEIQARTDAAEKVITDIDKNFSDLLSQYSDDEKKLRERIDNGRATDMDKFYIGMALLMPLIVGGFFGGEAALGTLAGGTKGLSDIYGRREKESREDEETIRELQKMKAQLGVKRGELELEKQKIPSTIQKSLPDDEKEFLKGTKEVNWVDPQTNEPMTGYMIKPGFVALPEFVTNKDEKKDMVKSANDLSEVKNYTDELTDLTDDVINIASQLKDKNVFAKGFTSMINGKIPGVLTTLTQDVMFDGRKVNAGQILQEKLGFLANAYAQAKQLGQLDRAAQSHIEKIMLNPTSTLASAKDTIDQMLEARKLAQTGLIRSMRNAGFAPEFTMRELEERNRKLFQGLNKGEQESIIKEEKKNLSRKG